MSWACERVNFESLKPARSDDEYLLHVAALEWSLAEPIVITSRKDIKSHANWRGRFEPYHHQVENLIRFCRMLPVTLLADDVGLGKTISAGLVLAELMERKRVSRALVICPAIMGHQWAEELDSKFGIPAVFAKGQELTNVLERSAVPVVITTYQTASKRMGEFRSDHFDMLILDEAHKLRNLHGTPNPPQMAQRVRRAMESRIFKYVLMLTATPIQNRVWDLYSLLDLLTVAKGHRNPLGTPNEFRSRYIADNAGRRLNQFTAEEFRAILRQYVVRTRREDARLKFPERIVETRKLRASGVETRMAQIVAAQIERLNAFAQISLGQAMMSSPQALARQLANMAENGSVEQSVADAARRLADEQPTTAKLEGLLKLVRELRRERPVDWRLVVFTLRKETQDAIGRALVGEGIAVDFIRGGAPQVNQSTMERFRCSPPKVNVIVSTDAGAEGVNLQAGNVVVNYDLAWNPMVMEQRIGRIQRLASKHENVVVVNLVIANSVEERVVARLLEKLQAIAETIGDIETILESTGQDDDDDSFEEMIRKLVVSSLVGQNVEQAMRAATSSIERAKERMHEERANIDHLFGPGKFDPAQPKPPKFEPVRPLITAEQFVTGALAAEGAILKPRADGTTEVIRPGQATERITFKPEVAEREASGVFMGNAPKLYLPGRPPFERLVQRWLQRSGHCVRDLSSNAEALTLLTCKAWCDGVPDTEFDSFTPKASERRASGGVVCRVKAANGVDSYEKLVHVGAQPNADGPLDDEVVAASPVLREQVSPETELSGLKKSVGSIIADDPDIGEFCRFYEARWRDELTKAVGDQRRRHKIDADFAPKVFADVVAMKGLRYDLVRAEAAFLLDGEHRYVAELELLPAARRVLREPERQTCSLTGRSLPQPCIGQCAISGKLATKHLLVTSAESGRTALPEYAARCEVTGRTLLNDETWKSDVSGRSGLISLFKRSPISGRKGLADEFAECEFTGAAVLVDEVLTSDLSGKRFRRDEAATSCASNRVGHRSEFLKCDVTGDLIFPEEAGTSAASGRVVRRDLLIASERPPHRLGLHEELVRCAFTGANLLRDEVVASAVSGMAVDKDLAAHSELSGRPALPSETVRCDVTGQVLLPDETDTSECSGKRVRCDLLVASPVSGRKALAEECVACEITSERVLPDELVVSDESGRRFRRDQAVTSAESGRVGHASEVVQCSASNERVLASESDVSAISGQQCRKSLLCASEKPPHRLGTADEFRTCAKTGKRLLADEVVASAVSGKLIDLDVAIYSDVSKQPALPDEVVTCEVSGTKLLPTEAGCSDVSGRLVRSELLDVSAISGRRGLKDEFATCEVTGVAVLADELERSDESGRRFRKDEAVRSAESGRTGHRSEVVTCSASNGTILKSESGRSAISGKTYSRTRLVPSEKNPERFGIASETVTCAKSRRRLLVDEVVKSAVSGQWIDRDLAKPSGSSGQLALADELVTCEESGVLLLPSERGTCSVTNKQVDKRLLAVSELSGKTGLRSRMQACAVSGKLALPSELVACDVTGKRVAPAELETCSVSRKRAIRYQFVRSDISGVPMLPEHAVWSPVSKRCCAPKESLTCAWRGVPFPRDEVAMCRLTGLLFSREFINEANEFRILRDLLDGREAGSDAGDLVGWLSNTLNGKLPHLKSARCTFSPDGTARAVCAEMRAMLGFKVRFAGLVSTERGDRRVLGRVVVGKRHQSVWTTET
jgi:superfamily II DNA or RNA helicase